MKRSYVMVMFSIASASTATVLLLLLLLLTTASAQADQATGSDQTTTLAPISAQLNNQSCFDLLNVKDENDDCPSDVLKFIGSIPRVGCENYCHVSRGCCIVTVALDTYHPDCWKYLMNDNASESDRYMLVMTCAKSLPTS